MVELKFQWYLVMISVIPAQPLGYFFDTLAVNGVRAASGVG